MLRVYELARKQKISTRELLLVMRKLRIRRKTPLSFLSAEQTEKIELELKKYRSEEKSDILVEERKERAEKKIPPLRKSSPPASKRETAPPPPPAAGFVDRGKPLPSRYDAERLVLLPVHPHKLYSYWEVSQKGRTDAVLRVYQGEDGSYFDINVDLRAENWYVDVPREGERYWAELGLMERGRFIPFLRSNSVFTPRKSFSAAKGVEFMKMQEIIREMKLDRATRSSLERMRSEQLEELMKRIMPGFAPGGGSPAKKK